MPQVIWSSPVPQMDDFGVRIGVAFIDGRTKHGPWAIMTPQSHTTHGVGLGTGRGQRYEFKADRSAWLKTEG